MVTGQEPILLNMAEFHDAHTINRIIGSPSGYVGSESARERPFDTLASNPYRVIVLDEFEKAHMSVQRTDSSLRSILARFRWPTDPP